MNRILLLGFISGLVLNIMPCILPIIAIKVSSLTRNSNSSLAEGKIGFKAILWLHVLGIVLSMMALSLVFVFIKLTDHSLRWGMQFQNPIFVLFLIFSMSSFVMIQSGDIITKVPAFLVRMTSKKYSNQVVHGIVSGFFVTIFSSACLGPTMANILIFAFQHESIMAIPALFLSFGLGIGAPFVVASVVPSITFDVFKKYNFSEKIKMFAISMMIATTLWLLFVLYKQIYILRTLIVFSMLGASALLSRKFKTLIPMVIVGVLCAFFVHYQHNFVNRKLKLDRDIWVPFSEEAIQDSVKENKVVLLFITADWCITCKFLKLTTFGRSDFLQYAYDNRNTLTLVLGDITKSNKAVEKFMLTHGYTGVPLVALFSPMNVDGKILLNVTQESILTEINATQSKLPKVLI